MAKRDIPPVDNLVRGLISLDDKTGRELAILGYAWIDAALHLVLSEYFWEKSQTLPTSEIFSKALRTSDSRLQVAHALGQITDRIRDQTDLVRKARNEFAHSIEDFDSDSPEIKVYIGQMNMTDEEMFATYATGEELGSSEELGFATPEFEYDGVRYSVDDATAFFDSQLQRVMFFIPSTHGSTPDDKLRRQIRLCVASIARGGLVKYIGRTQPQGVAKLITPYNPRR